VARSTKNDDKKRDDVAVKIDREVVRLAKAVASYRDLSLAEFISETLRPLVVKMFDGLPRERKHPNEEP
jgi:hypothetical protein